MSLVVAVSSVRERTIPGIEPGVVFPLLVRGVFRMRIIEYGNQQRVLK
jgi:hypothetical protein